MKGSYIIHLEWSKNRLLTSQMIRDKLLAPLQELWITHVIDKFTLKEGKSYLERRNTKKRIKRT
jgi:hypothetical protein